MKPAQVICISLMLAGTLLLAQTDRFPLSHQANVAPVAEQERSGLTTNFPEIPQGASSPQTRTAEADVRPALSTHSRHLRVKPQVQTGPEQVLYAFQGSPDGASPSGGLIFDSKGNLYGATPSGGSTSCRYNGDYTGCGMVFELTPDGSGGWTESVLYSFQGSSDGGNPDGGVIFDHSGNLYGTTGYGGANNTGTVFELSPNGSGGWTETVLYSFGKYYSDDANQPKGLIFDQKGNLYGAAGGGADGCGRGQMGVYCGTVFELSPNGSGGWTETVIYTFQPTDAGWGPNSGLVLDQAGNVYGTTGATVGSDAGGTVFELSPNGGGAWKVSFLYTFQGGNDGVDPYAGMIFDQAGNLYGTTSDGGGGACAAGGCGTVFELTPNGSGGWTESVLYAFSGTGGYLPETGLIFDQAGNLYGTTEAGGVGVCSESSGCGVVFELSPNGSGGWTKTVLYSFKGGNDGESPDSVLVLGQSGGVYGETGAGGGTGCDGYGCGTVFEVGEDFSLGASSSNASVMPGETAKYTVNVAPIGGFDQTVTLSCAGAPAMSTCSVSPSSVKLSGSGSTPVTVSVATTGSSAALMYPGGIAPTNMRIALWLAFSGLPGIIMLASGVRRRHGGAFYGLLLVCILLLITTWSACGGGSSSDSGSGTPTGTYTLTVTGTYTAGSVNLVHSTKLTLVVQ